MIDLRSDTVTRPTPAMRQAMASALVGDDVLGDDPTVTALEQRTAEVLGKESAVYMPSGTMTNQVALRAHTEHGNEVLLDSDSHVYFYECGAPAALSGLSTRLIQGQRGIFTLDQFKAQIRPPNLHFPQPRLVVLENTHNRGGGSIWPLSGIQEICDFARKQNISTHLDGARLWNASVATGIAERQYAACFESVSVCFSKGLGAPVGSALAGSTGFIARARRFRKMFGGGMRQAGIIAAGALYALDNNRSRLADDHANAKLLAAKLAGVKGVAINPDEVQTNIVVFRVAAMPAAELVQRLGQRGVAMMAIGSDTVRAVTSMEVDAEQIVQAAQALAESLSV